MPNYAAIRRVFLWLHMVTGLGCSLYAVLIGTTGSLLVFREELTALEYPQFFAGPARALRVSPDAAMAAVRAAYPEWTPYSLTWPNADCPYFLAYEGRSGESQEIFVDPATARVIGSRDTRAGLVGWLTRAHFNLLLGRVGRTVQGFGVVALLGMCVSGLWLWWPSRRTHHLTGITSLAFIAMWAITGGYYVWMNSYIGVVDKAFARTVPPRIDAGVAGQLLSLAGLAARAQAEFPERPIYRMSAPVVAGQPVSVTLLEDVPAKFHLVSTVYLDPVTGAVLQKSASADRETGNAVLSWISVLHFGRFGNGAVRVLWALLGLSLPVLAATGCWMWWRRMRTTPAPSSTAATSR